MPLRTLLLRFFVVVFFCSNAVISAQTGIEKTTITSIYPPLTTANCSLFALNIGVKNLNVSNPNIFVFLNGIPLWIVSTSANSIIVNVPTVVVLQGDLQGDYVLEITDFALRRVLTTATYRINAELPKLEVERFIPNFYLPSRDTNTTFLLTIFGKNFIEPLTVEVQYEGGTRNSIRRTYTPDTVTSTRMVVKVKTLLGYNADFRIINNACQEFTWYQFYSILSSQRRTPEKIVNISPNPATDNLSLQVPLEHSARLSIRIVDILGREVFREENTMQSGIAQRTLNIRHLRSGTYLLEIRENDILREVQRFVKE